MAVRLDTVPTGIIGVAGTNSWADIPLRRLLTLDRHWWKPGSQFMRNLAKHGIVPARTDRIFQWDTELGGLFYEKDDRGWSAAGASLFSFCEYLPYDQRNLIAHSHGGQVVLHAVAQGLEVRNVLFFGVPVRKHGLELSEIARPRINYWHCVVDPDDDTQAKGSWFDGDLKLQRSFPQADSTDWVKGIGHSSVLYDTSRLDIWANNKWLDMLKMKRGWRDAA